MTWFLESLHHRASQPATSSMWNSWLENGFKASDTKYILKKKRKPSYESHNIIIHSIKTHTQVHVVCMMLLPLRYCSFTKTQSAHNAICSNAFNRVITWLYCPNENELWRSIKNEWLDGSSTLLSRCNLKFVTFNGHYCSLALPVCFKNLLYVVKMMHPNVAGSSTFIMKPNLPFSCCKHVEHPSVRQTSVWCPFSFFSKKPSFTVE